MFDLWGRANAAIAENSGLKTRRRKALVEPRLERVGCQSHVTEIQAHGPWKHSVIGDRDKADLNGLKPSLVLESF